MTILRKLIISNRPLDKHHISMLSNSVFMRQNYSHHIVRNLTELENYKDKYWIWIGSYNNSQPWFNNQRAVRTLYGLLRIEPNRRWRISPKSPDQPNYDVNPYRYKLSNGYDAYYDKDEDLPSNHTSDDVTELVELIPDYWATELPPLNEIHSKLGGLYDECDIEEACKILGRTIPILHTT